MVLSAPIYGATTFLFFKHVLQNKALIRRILSLSVKNNTSIAKKGKAGTL